MTSEEISLLDLVEQPVFVLEPDDTGAPRYVAFNAFARNILGRPLTDILGKTAAELYGGRIGQITLERHMTALRTGETMAYDIILPVQDGERMIRTVLRPVLSKTGEVIRIVATSKDETERHTLRELRAKPDTASHESEQFVNFAAHDLRAPMRHVATLAEMMHEDFRDLEPDRLELVGLLEDVSKKTMTLISDVLSRAQRHAKQNAQSSFNLTELLHELSATLDPFRTCRINAPDGWIDGDRDAYQVLLRNILDNALKYARPSGTGGSLKLDVTLSVPLPRMIELSVRDNGTGFSAAALAGLQDDTFTNDSGFGLVAIRRLIQSRGGTLEVANRTDAPGAEIRIRYPGIWSENARHAFAAPSTPARQRTAAG